MLDCARFYEREMDQRSELRSAVSTPLGLFSLLGALVVTMVQAYPFDASRRDMVFLVAIAGACSLLAGAAYYLINAYHGHTYKGLPTAKELRDYQANLVAWYETTGGSEKDAELELKSYLDESYSAAAHFNAEVNLRKWNFLYLSNRRLIYAALALAVAAVPFLSTRFMQERVSIQLVELTPTTREALRYNVEQIRAQGTATATTSSKADAAAAEGYERR